MNSDRLVECLCAPKDLTPEWPAALLRAIAQLALSEQGDVTIVREVRDADTSCPLWVRFCHGGILVDVELGPMYGGRRKKHDGDLVFVVWPVGQRPFNMRSFRAAIRLRRQIARALRQCGATPTTT